MHELKRKAEHELDQIAQQGLTTTNLEIAYKLVDIVKDIYEIEESKEKMGESSEHYGRYMGDYRMKNDYRPSYRGKERIDRSMDRLRDGVEMYEYGREKYGAGGSKAQMHEGLENMMYAICSLIESGMDIAETAEEKEIIRKHIKKLQSL